MAIGFLIAVSAATDQWCPMELKADEMVGYVFFAAQAAITQGYYTGYCDKCLTMGEAAVSISGGLGEGVSKFSNIRRCR
jgi:hypothetical protein